VRCSDSLDSDCIPGALAQLSVGYGVPPELVVDGGRTMQLVYQTDQDCEFALTRLKAADELHETYYALGHPAILGGEYATADDIAFELVDSCDCPECCSVEPGRYEVAIVLADGPLGLMEGETADGVAKGMQYRFRTRAANVRHDCTKSFFWDAVQLL
jgi:hypothetical protein